MGLFKAKKNEDKKATAKSLVSKSKSSKIAKEQSKPSMKDLYSGTKNKSLVSKDSKGTKTKIIKNDSAYKILLKPLITEKAADLATNGKYVFSVAITANKIEIAKAINQVYGVEPIAVNVINNIGKKVRYGQTMGRRKDWKKAIVTLPKGKTINIYEGV